MKRLLNISTHPGDPEMFDDDWSKAADFLDRWGFDGFELYPVGDYPFHRIPSGIIGGVHLRFFVILAPIWRGDHRRLLEIFGDWQAVEHFYGGRDATWIANFYASQLDLAKAFEAPYVVFHPVHCELDYVYDWQFPWQLKETLDLCAEVINAATATSSYKGKILFENLWWPGSFRLDRPEEYDYLLSRIDYPNCGIALDTGHLLNKNPQLENERQATDYLLDCIDRLGNLAGHIHTVHLTRSLSGDYIRKSQKIKEPYNNNQNFWERFDQARRHVDLIDRHDPFENECIGELFEKIDPDQVVFEFTFKNKEQWEQKIAKQRKALRGYLWEE